MNLPEFPTDDGTLDLIMMALDPGPEAERTSLSDLLELMSQMGGSDTTAVESIERIGGLPGLAEDLIADDEGAYEVHIMRDPMYHEHDVIKALIKALRETREEVDDKSDVGHLVADAWEVANLRLIEKINAVMNIDPAESATKSRDFGRGFSEALRQVRAILGYTDV